MFRGDAISSLLLLGLCLKIKMSEAHEAIKSIKCIERCCRWKMVTLQNSHFCSSAPQKPILDCLMRSRDWSVSSTLIKKQKLWFSVSPITKNDYFQWQLNKPNEQTTFATFLVLPTEWYQEAHCPWGITHLPVLISPSCNSSKDISS